MEETMKKINACPQEEIIAHDAFNTMIKADEDMKNFIDKVHDENAVKIPDYWNGDLLKEPYQNEWNEIYSNFNEKYDQWLKASNAWHECQLRNVQIIFKS
jgi:hypothetical protein